MKRVPILDPVAHLDALWRHLSPEAMEAEESARQASAAPQDDPESLI